MHFLHLPIAIQNVEEAKMHDDAGTSARGQTEKNTP